MRNVRDMTLTNLKIAVPNYDLMTPEELAKIER